MNSARMRSTPTSCQIIDLRLPGATAFSTLRGCRDAGVPYDGFNACHYTGDDPEHIARCREAAAVKLGLSEAGLLLLPRQTHTPEVAVVDRHSVGDPLMDIDGLVTADPSIAIGINTADCVPILLSDPAAGVIAAIHSGWRGTVSRISARAVDLMAGLGADRSRIRAVFGPYIHPEAYEVGPELIDIFRQEFADDPDICILGPGRPHLDLGRAVRDTLLRAGIAPDHIADCGICSFSSYDRVFSARRLGVASGRTLTAARLARSNASI